MSQINDVMVEVFDQLGYTGAISDQIDQFKEANAPWTGWDDFLANAGYVTGHISDRKYDYFNEWTPPP